METGIAKNCAAAINFLNSCEAVISYKELNDDLVSFEFDETFEVYQVPDYVSFDADIRPWEE